MGNDPEERSTIAFEEMRLCADAHDLAAGRSCYHKLSDDEVERLDARAWNCIKTFFENEWFSRVWVQQEYGLNGSTVMYWGASSISSSTVRVFYHWLHWTDDVSSSAGPKLLDSSHYATYATFKLARMFRSSVCSWNFLNVLSTSVSLLATDPRDYIYGFLGHPAARIMSHPENKLLVTPDYNKNVEEVYMDTTIALIQDPGYGIEVMSHVHHNYASLASDTPSWVVRWHNKAATPVPPTTYSVVEWNPHHWWRKRWDNPPPNPIHRVEFSGNTCFDASKATSGNMEIGRERLLIKGVCYDRIESVREDPETSLLSLCVAARLQSGELLVDPERIASSIGTDFDTIMLWFNTGASPYIDVVLAAAFTLSCGWFDLTSPKRAVHHLDQFKRNLKVFCDRKTSTDLLIPSDDDDSLADLLAFELTVKSNCFQRNLVRSEQGFLGLAPLLASKGDYIAVFADSKVPFIIRPASEGASKLVGECYVEGIMDGEAVDRRPRTTTTLI